ncbi:helix-turn-helix domain-containing protein [Streptomyces sp. TLI_171]|uniref:helix-turn-helix domain-containing protein n=1 Tax=Streptomyces sp. TLI_171 TaxID=1938859 RepID=UPI000C191C7D|nr:XRE family transcriptional regulator [Streptomyces sp. TLI_171]RKE17616.1 XRE family transcriptional regulator [Streptomyces sp. TLI_171]
MRAADQPTSAAPPQRAGAELSARVGVRLRELRTARGLSLSELARRSGLGKATLSGLEAGVRNPTLETLYALTTALGLPLSAALPVADSAAADRRSDVSGRVLDAVLLDRFEGVDAVTETYRIRIRPGGVQHSAPHTPGTTEQLTVLAGTARAGDAGSPALLGPGDHHTWAADAPHSYRALDGEVEAVLLVRHPGR